MDTTNELNATDRQKILNRVAKMLRLANDAGATEGERDNALRMAHATLAKYNLDLVQVEATTKTKNADEPRIESGNTFNGYPWARSVANSIAELFFCSYLYQSTGRIDKTKHLFIGRHSNAVTAGLMAEFVVKAIHRESGRAAREAGAISTSWNRNFLLGAAYRIRERVKEIRQTAEAAPQIGHDGPGTALVLASLYKTEADANADFIQSKYPVLRTGRSKGKGATDYDALQRGRKYADSVSLNAQIGGGK